MKGMLLAAGTGAPGLKDLVRYVGCHLCGNRTTRWYLTASLRWSDGPNRRKGMGMNRLRRLLAASLLMVPLLGAGCAEHRQVYTWGPGENTYYIQWEHETHRDHREWNQRNESEHSDYWKWRKHHHDESTEMH